MTMVVAPTVERYIQDSDTPDLYHWSLNLPVGFLSCAQLYMIGPSVGKFLGEVMDWTIICKDLIAGTLSLGDLNMRGFRLAAKSVDIIVSDPLSPCELNMCCDNGIYRFSLGSTRGSFGRSGRSNLQYRSIRYRELRSRFSYLGTLAMSVAAANDTFPNILPNRWTLLDRAMELEKTYRTWPEVMEIMGRLFWDERLMNR